MIRIRGVRKSFESQLVLDGVDLDIPERSVVSIIGPSGSGKSTLLRTIDFLETANAGTIDFGEGPVSLTSTKPKDIASVRAKIGFVFQNYNLFLNRTVWDNVAIGLIHAKGKGRKEAVRIAYDELDRVGMAGFADRYPSKLSGGQQQRVAIARSLVNEPEILLLDEPLGALDLKLRKEMQLELKRLQREMNITFIYVTHDQEEALTMSDTVVVMNGGKVQQIGTPEDIYNEPKNAFVADFIGDSNIVDGVMHRDFLVSFSGVDFPCVDRGFAREQSVQVVVRPEDIEVVSPVEGQLVGVVNDVIFKGVHFEMHVECEGREWLIHSTRACTPGETIGMRIGPNEIHIMARSEG